MNQFQLRNLKRGDKVVILTHEMESGEWSRYSHDFASTVTKVFRGEYPYIRVRGIKERVTPDNVICQKV